MTIKVTLNNKSMAIASVYRPPNDEDATDLLITKISLLHDRYKSTKIVVIFGDLNYRREKVDKAFKKTRRKKIQNNL